MIDQQPAGIRLDGRGACAHPASIPPGAPARREQQFGLAPVDEVRRIGNPYASTAYGRAVEYGVQPIEFSRKKGGILVIRRKYKAYPVDTAEIRGFGQSYARPLIGICHIGHHPGIQFLHPRDSAVLHAVRFIGVSLSWMNQGIVFHVPPPHAVLTPRYNEVGPPRTALNAQEEQHLVTQVCCSCIENSIGLVEEVFTCDQGVIGVPDE
jgi:hypothetical protein